MSHTFFHRFCLFGSTSSGFGLDFESEASNLSKKLLCRIHSGDRWSRHCQRQVAGFSPFVSVCVCVCAHAHVHGFCNASWVRLWCLWTINGGHLGFLAFQPGTLELLCKFLSWLTQPKLLSVGFSLELMFSWYSNGLLLNLFYYHGRDGKNHMVAGSCSEGFLGHAPNLQSVIKTSYVAHSSIW